MSQKSGLALLGFAFVVFTLPTITTGQFHGYDVWYYVNTTELIYTSGWNPPNESANPSAYLYPGLQLLTATLAKVVGLTAEQMAKFAPILLKILPILFIYLIVRLFVSPRYALFAPLLLVGFYNYVTWMPYHHLTFGYVLKLVIIYVFLRTLLLKSSNALRRHSFVLMTVILFIALLLSHQLSTFHVLAFLFVTISILQVAKTLNEGNTHLDSGATANQLLVLLILMGILFAHYYSDLGSRYLVGVLSIQLSGLGSSVPPDPVLVSNLSLNQEPGIIGKLTESKFVISVEILIISVSISLVSQFRRIWSLSVPSAIALIIAVTWLGTLAFLSFINALTPITIGGLRRQFMLAIPFGAIIVGILYEQSSGRNRQFLRVSTTLCVALFLVVNMQVYPGHYVNEQTTDSEGSYELIMTEQRRVAYEHLPSGSTAFGSTQAYIYLNAMRDDVAIHESYYPYTGLPEYLQEDSYLIIRPEFKSFLLMRTQPYQYRIPEQRYESYQNNPSLTRIYANGVSIYQANKTVRG